ncbi:MAG: biotin--[acetyl-CoA-carboxylase] ligase [Pseudobdellovibrionaceae bacterium]|jgi:biotin-(acetyl-CoA carboxylase) ligase
MNFLVGQKTAEWAAKSGVPAHYFKEVTSTNTLAKDSPFKSTPAPEIYVTEFQTAGRGRNQNTWQSAPGESLLSSWVYHSHQARQPVLSPLVGLALYRALQASFPFISFSLKAPNDIYAGHQKIAGLLIENVIEGRKNKLVIGLGLNVFSAPELSTATSLQKELRSHGVHHLHEEAWFDFLDRWTLELGSVVAQNAGTLGQLQQTSLLFALNKKPDLTAPYTQVSEVGSLQQSGQWISWSEL